MCECVCVVVVSKGIMVGFTNWVTPRMETTHENGFGITMYVQYCVILSNVRVSTTRCR